VHIFLRKLSFMCRCIKYKLSALQVTMPEQNTLNATTDQFI